MKNQFIEHLLELLEPFGAVTARRMFGGTGLFHNGLMFAIVMDELLYLKADDENCTEFESRGLQRFTYKKQGKEVSLSYYEAPAEAVENPAEMRKWAEFAYAAAVRAAKKKILKE